MDELDSNTHVGWLHYYAAYLLVMRHIITGNLVSTITQSSQKVLQYYWQTQVRPQIIRSGGTAVDHPEWDVYISDMELMMLCNKWFYYWNEKKRSFQMIGSYHYNPRGEPLPDVKLDNEAIHYWINQLR